MDQTSLHLRAAVEGAAGSLEWIVIHFGPFLEAQIRFRLGRGGKNDTDVEDVVAEVWMRVLPRLSDLQARDGHLAPVLAKFLSTTALNLTNNSLRARIRLLARGHGEKDPGQDDAGDPLDEQARQTLGILTRIEANETCGLIREALGALSEVRRQVLVLRLFEQRSNREVAEILDVRANTAAVHYKRGIEELRARLPSSISGEVDLLAK
ncbi:MAG: RNA polymerase sigma factor [bacterium]|nr:RNA polymerase sigma factor [bacterium]